MSEILLTINERLGARAPIHAGVIKWQSGVPLTVRLLIEERVQMEWDACRESKLLGTSRPDEVQHYDKRNLELKNNKRPSKREAIAAALAGFQANAFFVIVDNRQVQSLDEIITLRPTSAVTFVRLIPLVAG